MKRLAIISTHPIQYNAPFFKLLAKSEVLELKVFYTYSQSEKGFNDPGFGQKIDWDIPLLNGYTYEFVENTANNPSNRAYGGIKCPNLLANISAYAPNAILVYGWNFNAHFSAMKHFKGKIPVWFRGDSHLLDEKLGFKSLVRRLILKYVYKFADKAFYVGTHNKAYFKAHGFKPKNLIYAPHAIDNERFSDPKHDLPAAAWRKELKIPENAFVVLFSGKFEAKKQASFVVEAAKHFNKLTFILIGSGVLENKLKKEAKSLSNVLFLPFQNQQQMPLVYRLANIFVYPSKGPGETWGLAVNEAFSCGIPAIISNKVGCAKDIVNHKTGKIFDANSFEDFKLKLGEMVSDSTNLIKKGKNAHELIKSHSFYNFVQAIETEITQD